MAATSRPSCGGAQRRRARPAAPAGWSGGEAPAPCSSLPWVRPCPRRPAGPPLRGAGERAAAARASSARRRGRHGGRGRRRRKSSAAGAAQFRTGPWRRGEVKPRRRGGAAARARRPRWVRRRQATMAGEQAALPAPTSASPPRAGGRRRTLELRLGAMAARGVAGRCGTASTGLVLSESEREGGVERTAPRQAATSAVQSLSIARYKWSAAARSLIWRSCCSIPLQQNMR